jgi:hypothetical protein
VLLNKWRDAIAALRGIVTPDRDGDVSVPNYGSSFEESDYAPIPPRDLPLRAAGVVRRRRLGDVGTRPATTTASRGRVATPTTRSSGRHPRASPSGSNHRPRRLRCSDASDGHHQRERPCGAPAHPCRSGSPDRRR